MATGVTTTYNFPYPVLTDPVNVHEDIQSLAERIENVLNADIPISTGISGLGTGVATALGVNVGTAGAPVVNGGALGTPSSGTLTSATGLPIAGLTASTTTALGVGSVELGHATDTTIARVSAGVVSIEGNNILVSGGALGTPASGTLTNATGLPVSGITASTSAAIGVGSIELGHATDTTIARVSAGVVSIEGVNIQTGTAWANYTPTWTNFTVGNGSVTSRYAQIGKVVFVNIIVTLGSTSSVTGIIYASLPVTGANTSNIGNYAAGIYDASPSTIFLGSAFFNSTTQVGLKAQNSAGTYVTSAYSNSTTPMTWTTNDAFQFNFNYEAA